MVGVSLQFLGADDAGLLALLGGGIAAALGGYGLWELLLRGRRARGVVSMLAAGVVAGALVLASTGMTARTAAGRLGWLVLLAMIIALAVGVFYSAVYAYLGRRRMAALLVLRFGAICALLLILFKPAVSIQPARGGGLALPVLVDRSASMGTLDHPDLPNRYRQAGEALAAQQERLAGHFRVRWYHFAAKVQAVDDVEELLALEPSGPDAEQTNIVHALRRATAGYAPEELAGVLLVSDGLHNAGGDVLDAAGECPVPIYVIGVGSEDELAAGRRNVQVVGVDAPLEAVRDNVTKITARVRLTGWANIPARVVLSEGDRQVLERQVITDANARTVSVQLDWTPGEPPESAPAAEGADVRRLRLRVQPNPAEATAEDNDAEIHVLVTRPSIRVLYVEGTLRPEYKYLRRLLATDPNVKSICLVRLAENRFLSQGSIDGKRLLGLPRSPEDFDLFDVIILGDLDRTFLTTGQMERIRRFVNDGKALLMLGGRNAFGPGGYGGTPVEAALPVVCGGRAQPQETTPFVPQLTAAGVNSPVFAGLSEYFHTPSARASKPLPTLLGCVTVVKAKPTASVLAVHPTRGNANGPLVVLAVHNYGAGRAAAFTADTTGRWYRRLRPLGAESPYNKFWGQLIRYLAGVESKRRRPGPAVLGRTDRTWLRQGEALKIAALVKNAEGRGENDATVTAALAGPGGREAVVVPLARVAGAAGLYEASYRAEKAGTYTLTLTAVDKQGAKLGEDRLPVIVAPHSRETDRLARDTATLRAIAARRDGRYAELSALPDVIDQIIQRQRARLLPAPPARQVRLYNFTLLFLAFVALLTVEWVVRRRWQLQ